MMKSAKNVFGQMWPPKPCVKGLPTP